MLLFCLINTVNMKTYTSNHHIPKPVKKRKKKMSILEYINNPNANVDEVLNRKHKIDRTIWKVVHYFNIKLDNTTYLDHFVNRDPLDFEKASYIDELIKNVAHVSDEAQTPLDPIHREYFEEQKITYERNKKVEDEQEKKYEEDRKNIDNIKRSELGYAENAFNSGIQITKIVNKFKCQLCGSTLNHVFIAQHSENFKKIVLGRTCVKILLPESEWKKIITKEKVMKSIQSISKRVSFFIEQNNFNLQEHLRNSAITEFSLIKQILVIEKAYPRKKKDDQIKLAIDTLCFTSLRTIKMCFLAWKNRMNKIKKSINGLSKIIETSKIKKLTKAFKIFSTIVQSFNVKVNFKKMTPIEIKDHANVIISLLEDKQSEKKCYLELSNIALSVHSGYSTYMKIYSDNKEILNTINQIEQELQCTRLTALSYPITLKITDKTAFYTSKGLLFHPFMNQIYRNCNVSVALKTYIFNNTTGLSRVCARVTII